MFNKIYESFKNNIKYFLINIILITIVLLVCLIKVPYYIHTPGGTINASNRIDGSKYKSKGSINLTYVSSIDATLPILAIAKILPSWDIVSTDKIKNDHEDINDLVKRDKLALEESISNATFVAFKNAKKNIKITKSDYYVIYISEKANTGLKVGDKILKIDNKDIHNYDEILNIIKNKKKDDVIKLNIIRDNKRMTVSSKLINIDSEVKMGILISKINSYKLNPKIKYNYKSSETGSSGGLMVSLAIYNSLTKTDVTKGKKICGTGTITEDGIVGDISGVKYKITGAIKNKCDIFIVPTKNYPEAKKYNTKFKGQLKLIEAKNFKQVVKDLR